MLNILIASILGGIFVSDVTAAGQLMISRPIFCAPIIGWIAGDIQAGLMVGFLMELVWINIIPLGNAVPPDATVVSVAGAYLGGAFASSTGADCRGFIVFTILCLIPAGILFKKLDIIHREYNSYLCGEIEEKIKQNNFNAVDRGIYMGWLFFILKGALFTGLIIVAGLTLFTYLYGLFDERAVKGLNLAFYLIPAVGLAAAAEAFSFKKSRRK